MTPVTTLGPGAEFDLIRRFLARAPVDPPAVLVGAGDDAAVLEGGWVLSCDLSVEDVHFRRAWLGDAEIGFRATAAALSDLAAMAAEPVGVLVALAGRTDAVDLEGVHSGAREAAASVGAGVLGGDVSGSPGPLVIDVTAVGRSDAPALRVGARSGDEVWVTGTLGASAAAVEILRAGGAPGPVLRSAFSRPAPRVAEARWLSRTGALQALIDVSDGLAGDAGHLAAAGGVRIVLDVERVPASPAASAEVGDARARHLALHGGEDYELLVVAAPGVLDAPAFGKAFGLSLTRIGLCEEGEGVWTRGADGRSRPLESGGFDHLRVPGA